MGDDRPFVCNAPGCGQRFTNEDHLAVHKHKHEMTLKFGPARTDSVIIADQTPTPTRFLKNCEEVGLFNELASSFEHEFKKAAEDDEKKSAGALDMSLPSTPDIKIKEEEPVEVDSSPPDSPASNPQSPQNKEKEITSKPVIISTPTPTIVRPGSLPLHLGYDPLHPTLPSPTSVITQAPPSNRQLGSPTGSLPLVVQLANGQTMPVLPGPPVQMPSVISLARPMSMVPNIPGIPGPPINSSGSISPSGLPVHSEAKMRLKASLTASASLNGSNLVVGSASTMVTARPEQSQILVQHPDAPSPAQPQVSPAQPTPSTGGRRRRTVDEDPDERRQRFLERNRAAASRCRQKRKLWVSSLEKKAEELTTQNIQLSNEVTLLRNEVAQLKQLLLAHKDCPVTALQKKTQGYLAKHDVWILMSSLQEQFHAVGICGKALGGGWSPLALPGLTGREAGTDGDKKRKGEKTKAEKASPVLPLPISWVSETLFFRAVRHKYVLHRAWHSPFIFTHYSDSELE
ncbi:cyclic AMP-dependent transcription factor ATF-7 isoform X1 [Tyto alba]|uniref:cyclic AMP-dependent transcription factor ATF-7 isoform X1 n=1 Tax=Tyto alba TaxID=56313 RepID=UPI001401D410|nr:cyclic AMP-dependent transcription factor ATF-7 isoform X1 [Tyto alba]XP_032844983.1 cyclic AMP-dependent transcription factor ATF-7 isoform X1 [Tyto alba]XP_032844989.1 cyclic AMP-dependent transcription factor ATF-7 isoform X1 [Tyto alba]XP_032844997.1 cyclic AMP-dependent transcription factor ATF-7 isoform X1 [Tyto alba]XP_032845007.1 cyclic AMP-dependent transcription factor ATF-7 isoform X1 [Tyto alba]XP_032845013.1 cyclic AMP-dependent transcription factor ATF-7 isoform X1 [Tyto alba]